MDLNSVMKTVSFKGKREDVNNIKDLTKNRMPILPNKRQLILSAIESVAQNPDENDIKMLMGTVETMKYGIHNNSEFAKALGGTNGEKENTDWDGILKETVRNAIDDSDIADKSALEAQFKKVFVDERPLTEEEKTMLDLRQQILSSKEMKNVLDDPDKTFEATRVSQNLNYFIASSEINNEDKIKCLKLMNHFLSDEYEINPQLKDHKVQAFSEMVNDLIIKRPDEDALTIKDVSQKQTGMCAAISIARKNIAYEDKVRAMEIMMAELDNKPTMEVYDRTQLGSGKKINIEKVHVDFTDAMKKGYRIIDAGTHQWMNAANVVGDGSVSTARYQAFDPENYEIFRDAKWFNDLAPEYKPAQTWLRYLSKEQSSIDTVTARNNNIKKVTQEVTQFKSHYETISRQSEAKIRKILSNGDSQVTELQAANLARQIVMADKLENPKFRLNDSYPPEVQEKKLVALIKSEMPNISDRYIDDNLDDIFDYRDMAVNANDKLGKLREFKSPKSVFAYNKNLFSAAAHHRRSVEAELELPERLAAYETKLNVPTREVLVQDYATKILSKLDSSSVLENTAQKFGVEADRDLVKSKVENAERTSEVEIPAQLDNILGKLGFGDRVSVVKSFISEAQEKIKSGDNDTLYEIAENAHVKPNAALVLKKLAKVNEAIENNPSNRQIADAVKILGYNNQIEMTADMFRTVADAADEGELSREQLDGLFGSDADKQLADIGKNIKLLSDKQAEIERQLGIPSRKEIVLNVLEKTGEIVPEKTLQAMQAKFDKVAEMKSESDNRIVDPSVKKPVVPDSAYMFTKEEKEQFARIEKNIPSWNNYASSNAAVVEQFLEPQLNELYAETGRLTGHLWVSGEGESGLYDNQSIKILEMITGQNYYNEPDIDKVVAHIKKGEGSGTSSTNVDHRSYSGHAQYVAEVSQVEVIDSKTKQKVMKDVLWHDNTWGRAEDSVVWTDKNGVKRTDYGNGYGGPDGYVFDKRLLTGTFVDDVKITPGVLRNGQKFDLWSNTRLKGTDPKAQRNIDKLMNDIFDLGNAEQKVAEFESAIKSSSAPVDIKLIEKMDRKMNDFAENAIEDISYGNIKNQKSIDAAEPELKFVLEKTALQMSVNSEQIKDFIGNIKDSEGLQKFRESLPKLQKEMISSSLGKGAQAPRQVAVLAQEELLDLFNSTFTAGNAPSNLQSLFNNLFMISPDKFDGSLDNLKKVMGENAKEVLTKGLKDKKLASRLAQNVSDIFAKVIDDKIAVKTADDIKNLGESAELMTKFVDNKFDTKSDEDLVAAYKKLQNMTNAEFDKFMDSATNEDLGIKNVTALDVAKQVRAQKEVATNLLKQNARVYIAMTEGPERNDAPEWVYRNMKMSLSPIDNYNYVTQNAKTMLYAHGVRNAFPKAEILPKEEIEAQAADLVDFVAESVKEISNTKNSKAKSAAELNSELKNFVNTNVLPSQRERAKGLLNSYVKILKNNPESESVSKFREEAMNFISANHITSDTGELVKDFALELQAKNPSEDKLAALRNYLTLAVESSDIASVEYSMIDNASDAIAAMTREKLDDYTVTSRDGSKLPLSSDEGINFLIDKLANPANNSTAVQVFFAQTGLSEKAVDVINKSIKTKDVPVLVQHYEKQIVDTADKINKIENGFDKFLSDNSASYSTYKDALTHYIKTMDNKYLNAGSIQDKMLYMAYRQYMLKTSNADFAKKISADEVMTTLEKVHSSGISAISEKTFNNVEQLNSLSATLDAKISAMEALKLPKNSEKEKTRAEFLANAEVAREALNNTIDRLNKLLSNG